MYLFTPNCLARGTQLKEAHEFSAVSAQNSDGIKIFVEQMNRGDKNSEKLEERDALIFFKYWNPREGRLRYIGQLVFKPTTRVKAMVEEACTRFLPNLRLDEIEALEELTPAKIEDLKYTVIDQLGLEREAQLMDTAVELQSGDIIVIQPKEVAGTIECVKNHYDYLKNKVLVSFRAKATPEKEAFELALHGNSNYKTVCDKIAKRLTELELAQSPPADGNKIQLWKHLYMHDPTHSPTKHTCECLISQTQFE